MKATSADDLVEFEREFHRAMAEADDDFDLTRVQKLVGCWYGRALEHLNPDIAEYTRAVIERLQAGDESDIAEGR
ncbi:DUF6247 family protein [Amycolatopsis sp. NPDC059027]|uniref:DUF6247 family protein n=1 Tax=Amycolatopsis sp. NPDC059027 TaxID=3346709 RepID=UPI003670791D